jgi:hypothetical protein
VASRVAAAQASDVIAELFERTTEVLQHLGVERGFG